MQIRIYTLFRQNSLNHGDAVATPNIKLLFSSTRSEKPINFEARKLNDLTKKIVFKFPV